MSIDYHRFFSISPFFSEMGTGSRKYLSKVSLLKKTTRGQCLFMEGEEGGHIFICVKGTIVLYKSMEDGRRVQVKTVGPGEFFGEVVLFESPVYPATAEVSSSGIVFAVSVQDVDAALEKKEFRKDFISLLLRKQRYLAARLRNLSSMSSAERLRHILREKCGRSDSFSPPFSKKEAAFELNISPEALSRLLKRLRDRGILNWNKNKISADPFFWDSVSL
ncbi:MAG: Crp/Fnr family transcriptional regulator [Fibrobacterota bacterium]